MEQWLNRESIFGESLCAPNEEECVDEAEQDDDCWCRVRGRRPCGASAPATQGQQEQVAASPTRDRLIDR